MKTSRQWIRRGSRHETDTENWNSNTAKTDVMAAAKFDVSSDGTRSSRDDEKNKTKKNRSLGALGLGFS